MPWGIKKILEAIHATEGEGFKVRRAIPSPSLESLDPADERQVAAPMPGVVSTLSVSQGQSVKAGDLLLTPEAMKMETSITAPRDGKISELRVQLGQTVDAKELLLVLEG